MIKNYLNNIVVYYIIIYGEKFQIDTPNIILMLRTSLVEREKL